MIALLWVFVGCLSFIASYRYFEISTIPQKFMICGFLAMVGFLSPFILIMFLSDTLVELDRR